MSWLKNLLPHKATMCDDCEIKNECIGIPPQEKRCQDRLLVTKDPDGVVMPPSREVRLFYGLHVMPCCHTADFYEGPSGGLSTNIECCNCGARWNITPPLQLIEKI